MDQCNQARMKKLKKENRKLRKKLTLCQHLIERLQRVNEGYKKIINQSSTPIMKPSEDDRGNTTNGGMVNSTRGIKRRRIEEATIIDRRSLSLSPNIKVKANPSTGSATLGADSPKKTTYNSPNG